MSTSFDDSAIDSMIERHASRINAVRTWDEMQSMLFTLFQERNRIDADSDTVFVTLATLKHYVSNGFPVGDLLELFQRLNNHWFFSSDTNMLVVNFPAETDLLEPERVDADLFINRHLSIVYINATSLACYVLECLLMSVNRPPALAFSHIHVLSTMLRSVYGMYNYVNLESFTAISAVLCMEVAQEDMPDPEELIDLSVLCVNASVVRFVNVFVQSTEKLCDYIRVILSPMSFFMHSREAFISFSSKLDPRIIVGNYEGRDLNVSVERWNRVCRARRAVTLAFMSLEMHHGIQRDPEENNAELAEEINLMRI
jgi:hypothetical protein